MQLGSIQSLFGTDYGRVLLAKMALVALHAPALGHGVAACGGRTCGSRRRSRRASWRRQRCSRRFPPRRPPPHAQAAELAASTPVAGLPSAGDLTMAGPAGSVLVGLSLSPGAPGPNHALVYLVPIDRDRGCEERAGEHRGEQRLPPAPELRGHLPRGDDRPRAGRQGRRRRPQRRVAARRRSPCRPGFPPRRAPRCSRGCRPAMHALSAYQATEVLSSGITTIRSVYASDAPDKTTWTVGGQRARRSGSARPSTRGAVRTTRGTSRPASPRTVSRISCGTSSSR